MAKKDPRRRNWHTKSMEFFSESRISLSQEVKNHPDLLKLLANHAPEDWEIKIAEIAAYCEVALDGDYLPSDIDGICEVLYKRLVTKRVGIVFAREETKEEGEN